MQPRNFESRVQDMVYNVDVGIGHHVIRGGIYILSVIALLSIYTALEFWGLDNAEAMDQAQIARQLMQEGTFSTKLIRPAAVWMYTTNGVDARTIMLEQPDIVNPPVYPWVLSLAFRLVSDSFAPGIKFRTFPPEQWAMVPIGHLCTLLTGLVIFLMARRFFVRRIATLSASLFFVSEIVWSTSISGRNLSMVTLFTLLAVYLSLVTVEKINRADSWQAWLPSFLLTGIFCALSALTNYSAGLIIPGILLTMVMLSNAENRWKICLYMTGLILLLITPWFIRNYMVCGHFFGLTPYLALNGNTPGLEYSFESAVKPSLAGMFTILQEKWISQTLKFYRTALPLAGSGLLTALFLTTYFFRFARPHVHALRLGLLLSIISLFVVAGFFGDDTYRVFYIFWPLVILYGTSFFFVLMDRIQFTAPLYRNGLIALLLVFTALPLAFTLMPPRNGYPYPPYYPSYTTLVTQMLKDDELLCTDMPWATAWYGNVSSILLPATVEEFYQINDLQKRISGIYFTTLTRDLPYARTLATGPLASWFPIFNERVPINFPLTEAFFISGKDQLFLTDRPRWQR